MLCINLQKERVQIRESTSMFSILLLYLFSRYMYENFIKHLNVKKPTVSTDTNEHNSNLNDCDDLDKLSNYDKCDYTYGYKTPLEWYRPRLRFYTPVSIQRYDAVFQVLNNVNEETKLHKVVDFGCASLDFLSYLRRVKYFKEIMCVDIDREVLKTNIYKARPETVRWVGRDASLQLVVKICEGSVTDSDIQLQNTDAVTCIELIEHLYPHVLIDLPYNIFGYIRPKVIVMTTPNADFNVLFRNFGEYRHPDHKFEWTREQFQDWAENIVVRYPDYQVTFRGIGDGPVSTRDRGSCTQMAIFRRYDKEHEKYIANSMPLQSDSNNKFLPSDFSFHMVPPSQSNIKLASCRSYKILGTFYYPYKTDQNICEEKLLNNATKLIHKYMDCTDIPCSIKLSDLMVKMKSRENMETEDCREYTEEMLESVLIKAGWDIRDINNERVLVTKLSTFNSNTGKDSFNNTYSTNSDEQQFHSVTDPRIDNISTSTNDEYVLLPNPYHHDSNEELSIIIPQNDSVEQENAHLSHKEDSVSENFDDKFGDVSFFKYYDRQASINTDPIYHRLEPVLDSSSQTEQTEVQLALSPEECTSLETTREITEMSNFLPHLSISITSTSPEPLFLNSSELKDSLIDYSLENYQNESYNQSTVECEKNISMEESTTEDAFTCKEIFSENNSIQEDEINLSKSDYLEANISHNIKHDKNSDIMPLNMHTNFFNNQPKFTSSPKSYTNVTTTSTPKQNSSECEVSMSLINPSPSPSNTRNVKKKIMLYSFDCDNTTVEVKQLCKVPSTTDIENASKLSAVCANTAETSDIGTDIYLKERMDDLIQSDIGEKSLNTHRELSSSKSDNNSKYSCFESVKETRVLDDTFVSCTDDETTSNNQSISVLKGEKEIESDIKNPIIKDKDKKILNIAEFIDNNELKSRSPLETPSNSWSPEIIDSGYLNSASVQDITPEYDVSSIDQEYIPDSESPSVAEAPRLGVLEPIEVENGDLANNNRDDEGNNMLAADLNDLEDLQPLIDVLQNDLENENDIYVLQNGFPLWLLRILNNPLDFDIQDMRILNVADNAQYIDHDEGFEIENDNENDG